ncbi:MAG: A-macroglobulin complement component [Myxococcales bacterium]|nr:A-macroglobulin complement component [Myxococcales bacterium]
MPLTLASRLAAATVSLALFAPVSHTVVAKATTDSLGGSERYLTFLTTDKPIFRPGERVHVRGVLLEAARRTPLPSSARASVEIRGPRGDQVAAGINQTADGSFGFGWDIPAEQPGGEYTIRVTYPWNGFAPAERKFDVRAYRAPRLKSQIVFLRDGYGPGDKVTATLEVSRAEGGFPTGAKVTATAMVDGADVARVPAKVDEKGRCTVSFELPKEIARGEGALAFAIEDGGVVETAAKTIPILLQTLDIALYPEGGELVAGLSGRVYFEARTPAKKPADIAGEVVAQGSGKVVSRFRSEHEGRGRFELTPEMGERYALRVLQPSGIKASFPLPAVKGAGALIRSERDMTPKGQPVKLAVSLFGLKKAKLTLSKREVELASAEVSGGPVSLDPKGGEGVLVATVWDHDGRPLAERLVFREPEKALWVELRADRKSYVPGGEVKLTARTTVGGKPVSAVVGLSVADDSVLEMVEKREQAPRLPVMVLLESEVRELADAHLYLDSKNPKAPMAVDLLLGTQGWRRFAFVEPTAFVSQHGDLARRALALRIPTQVDLETIAEGAIGGRAGVRGAAREEMLVPAAPPMKRSAAPRPQAVAAPPMAEPAPMPAPPPMAKAPPARPPVASAPRPMGGAAGGRPWGPMRNDQADQKMQDALGKAELARKNARIAQEPTSALSNLVPVREYAHALRPGRKATDRVDFAETLYWNAGVRTDPKTGEATVSFALNDSVTSFKAFADAYGMDGALGAAAFSIESVQPFHLEPKLPLEVTSGDVVRLPLALVNGTSSPLRGAKVELKAGGDLEAGRIEPLDLRPEERARRILELKIGAKARPVELVLSAQAGEYSDSVTRSLSVKPRGFPVQVSFGGMLGPGNPAVHSAEIPEKVVPGSVTTSIAVYPTPLANMTESLASLIREPYGCFEQTSSTTYPLTMAQQYFTSHTGVDPALVSAAREKLEAGYKRLVGFECSEKGYEWFGQSPGHEALSAYGLLHFTDMRKVREVDGAMMERTRQWLLRQKDGKGGFNRKRRALHVWVEDADTSNAYILWSLLEAGVREVDKEVAALKEAAKKSENSYVHALAANVLALAKDSAASKRIMQRLAQKQGKDGVVEGGTQSIVGSGGEALAIETTSLAVLAWLREPSFAGNVERAIKYLADSCKGGRYGSTQSTVLALRAIVAYDQARARPKAPGSVRVFVDGQPVGSAVKFDASAEGAIKLPDVSELLPPGKRKLELRMEGGGPMPYAISVEHHALTPASSEQSKLSLEVSLGKAEVPEGELLEAKAVVQNRTKEKLPTAVAIVGLPGGLEPRHDQLKELVKKGTIDAYEVRGRDVVLYWRGVEAEKRLEVPLSLLAAVPGSYSGPASRAYLYYTDEHKSWVDGLKVAVTPKG